jgi:hypothetical protein
MKRPNVLAELKRRHDQGDRRAVLDAIFHCYFSRPAKAVPKWARAAFCEAYDEIFAAHARSWDDVFGAPYKKGTNLPAVRRRKALEYKAWYCVRDLHAAGKPLDDDMWFAAAKKLGIGRHRVKKYYYLQEKAGGHRSTLWNLDAGKLKDFVLRSGGEVIHTSPSKIPR